MTELFDRLSSLSPKRLALLALELQEKLDALQSARTEPIAVVGMGCRFPLADGPDEFWALLRDGVDAIREVPPDRWNVDEYFDSDPTTPGRMVTRSGGFLDAVDRFEPELFGISPREARTMDPQQRLLLEVAWEALEDAGIAPDGLAGSSTGTYVGLCNGDYGRHLLEGGDDELDMYFATGNSASVASGRLAYVFGLHGPAMTVDTSCSSSLVAVHLAVQALRDGACNVALAGGVNVILSPKTTVMMSRAKMLSPDGRCKAFDARADGFSRGEGCGLIVLKRLRDASADGDRILAVIRGSATNQDGRSNGLTAPNGPSQVDVIRAALADGGIEPGLVGFVEAHGTGTPLGDPIEARALAVALGSGREHNRLRVGSVKTNFGHLESAAGIAGLMKVILSLQHREIPPSLHLKEPNPRIPWSDFPIDVPTTLTPWDGRDGRYVAGVSSFGFSGTNAHLVVEAAPSLEPAAPTVERPRHVLTLSARTEASLREVATGVRSQIAADPELSLADVAHTLAVGRSHHAHRVAAIAATTDEAAALLDRFLAGDQDDARLASGTVTSPRPPAIAFLFTGHGAQYVDMGRDLYDAHPVYRDAIDRCGELLMPLMDQSLHDVIFDRAGMGTAERLLADMTYAQPAVFAVEYALAELWRSWGVEPAVVVGHSVGEYVAATVAGALELADGLKLVAARGRLMASLPANGAMATVLAPEGRVNELLDRAGIGSVSIAAVNGPESVALSGPADRLDDVLDDFRRAGVQVRPLNIPVAAHSAQVDPILDEFENVAATVSFRDPAVEVVSGMTGRMATGTDLTTASYWRRHLRTPVRFGEAFQAIFDRGVRTFVEIGPHPTLLNMGRHVVDEHEATWLPSLRSDRDDWEAILSSVARLYTSGARIDWPAFDAPYRPRRVALPTYPFARDRYWAEPRRSGTGAVGGHPLVGRPILSPALSGAVFEAELAADAPSFLAGHRIAGTPVVPDAAFVEMALTAAAGQVGTTDLVLTDLALHQPASLADDGQRIAQLIVRDEPGSASVEIVSRERDGRSWQRHATGQLTAATSSEPAARVDASAVKARCPEHVAGPELYARLAEVGLEIDPEFRCAAEMWRGDGEALARLELPDGVHRDVRRYIGHPMLLDACMQVLGATVATPDSARGVVVTHVEQFRVCGSMGSAAWCHAATGTAADKADGAAGDVKIYDRDGELIAEAIGVRIALADAESLRLRVERPADDWLYEVAWEQAELGADTPVDAWTGTWIVVGSGAELGRAVVERLTNAGGDVVTLSARSPSLGDDLTSVAARASAVRVVHLAGLDLAPPDTMTVEDLDRQVLMCVGSVFECVRSLVAVGTDAKMWIVTRGAQDATGTVDAPEQAPLWGLGRVVSLEHPELWGGLIDLAPRASDTDLTLVLDEIGRPGVDDQVAWRDGHRLVPRLVRSPRRVPTPGTWRRDGSYLVTGGLGGLGLKLAVWMAESGAGTIVLLGRRGLPPRCDWDTLDPASREAAQVAAIRLAEERGATVEVIAADVADRTALGPLMGRFGRDLPPLRGVVHAAADLSNHMIVSTPADALAAMLRPKVAGSWLLHELTLDQPLDFFVSFSSTAALWGSQALGHYAAANQFLDALAHHRRAMGLPALTVNWGSWDEMRFASDEGREIVRRSGLNPMPSDAALGLLADLLGATDQAEVTIASVDWQLLRGVYESRRERPFFAKVAARPSASRSVALGGGRPDLLARLDDVVSAHRMDVVIEFLQTEVARTLGSDRTADVETDQGLFEMGLDSLMSLELKKRIEGAIGAILPSTLTFNYPTIEALACFLLDGVIPSAMEPGAPIGPIQLLDSAGADIPDGEPGPVTSTVNRRTSTAQRRILFLEDLVPGTALHNIPNAVRLTGPLDFEALERALTEIVRRHEALRTNFFAIMDGDYVQRVDPPSVLPLKVTVLNVAPTADVPATLEAVLTEEANQTFDLATDLKLRACVVHLGDDDNVLILTTHHVASDGWSIGRLSGELMELYSAAVEDRCPRLPDLPMQYADYAELERQAWEGQDRSPSLAYWTDALGGDLPVLALPEDRPRLPEATYRGDAVRFELSSKLMEAVTVYSRRSGVTPFSTLLASYGAALCRFSGQEEVVVGTAAANRGDPRTDGLIGLFVNTLALRLGVDPALPFASLVQEVQTTTLGALAHQDVPFDRLVGALRPNRDLSRSPIFQTLFLYQNLPMSELRMPGLDVAPVPVDTNAFDLDIGVHLIPGPNGAAGGVRFNADVFDRQSVERLLEGWLLLLAAAVSEPDTLIGDLPVVTDVDRERLVGAWGGSADGAPAVPSVVELVRAQVDARPDAVAVQMGSTVLTHRDVDEMSNRVAHLLAARGVTSGDLVGVSLERSPKMVAVLVGVWKAGAAYVPLDPGFPAERLAFMVADSGLRAVVMSGAVLPDEVDLSGVAVVDLERDAAELASLPADATGVGPGDLAYVMYTSGSTGRPKGVAVSHANVVNFLSSMQREPGLSAHDVLLAVTTLSFDISVLELFLPLVTGATVVVASREDAADGRRLAALIESSQATVMQATPTTWSMLFDAGWSGSAGLRVLCGGEAMSRHLADRLVAVCGSVWNMFGPTETTVWSTVAPVERGGIGPVPIGRPITATVCRVLDKAGRLVPPGVVGELFIGGAGVAHGYWNRPELTAERFVADPYDPDGRLYRTGDVARWRADGQLEFLGRADHQVKVRGHRIELGEIETALRAHPDVTDVVVVARGAEATATLVAYIVTADPQRTPTITELRATLADRLPAYMIPNTFVTLDHLPLTPNRKIDRNALPDPIQSRTGEAAVAVAPRSEIERAVAAVWAEVLEVGSVGVDDDFFELGGHSLLATRMVARLRERLGRDLPVRAVFEAPTVAGMAAMIEARAAGPERQALMAVDRSQTLRLSFAQERMWFLEQLVPDSAVYSIPVGVRLRGDLDVGSLRRAVSGLVQRHETLRTRVVVDADGVPRPEIDPADRFSVEVVDLRGEGRTQGADGAVTLLRSMAHKPIDLAVGPVFRAVIASLGPSDHALLLVVHHIAADQWSLDVIVRDLAALYVAESSGVPAGLHPLTLDYLDFAAWQRDRMAGADLEAQLEFWRGELTGLTPVALPLDRPRPAVETFTGATVTRELPASLVAALEAFARSEGVTFFAAILASFQALLGRYGDQDDVAVGVPVSNRQDVAMEAVVGNFVNTLVIRNDLGGSPSFGAFVHRVQNTLLEAHAHQDIPFEVLVAELVTGRDMSRSPLVQVLFNILQAPFRFDGLAGLELEVLPLDREVAQFDLSVLVTTGHANVDPQVIVEFNVDVFDRGSVERLVEGWLLLLRAAVAEPDTLIGDLPVVTDVDRERLVGAWGGSADGAPAVPSVVELVRAHLDATPDAVAVRMGPASLTFRELDETSNRVAHLLAARGVTSGDLVGMSLERSPKMVAVLVGVWKAGAAYVPLDPGFPAERLAFMVVDSGLRAVVMSGAVLPDEVDLSGVAVVDLERDAAELASMPTHETGVAPGELAYVMYTSGSTGRPKGVAVSHANVVNFLSSMQREPGLSAHDVLLAVTTLSFDISVLELFLPLVTGATVVVASREDAADGRRLAALIESSQATVMQATPTTWSMLFDAGWSGSAGLRVLCGGEAMSRHLADRLVAVCGSVWNMFGPTETTVWSTTALVEAGGTGPVPIGRPITATVCRVLDKAGRLVPPGVVGELFIGGAGVAHGYWNRPELTAERFVADPYDPDGRLYRTGDVARWRADGELEFLGRADHQVKVRGHRIELGEIEAALRTQADVVDVVVVARGTDATATLVAYLVLADPEHTPTVTELRAALSDRLPAYMIPNTFVTLDHLPLTPNRKVDRKALPDPVANVAGAEYIAPRNHVEHVVAKQFAVVLDIERVGAADSFFELGGHSLQATSLLARLEGTFGVEVGLRTFFAAPTVEATAAALLVDAKSRARVERIAQLRVELEAMSPEEVARRLAAKRGPRAPEAS